MVLKLLEPRGVDADHCFPAAFSSSAHHFWTTSVFSSNMTTGKRAITHIAFRAGHIKT